MIRSEIQSKIERNFRRSRVAPRSTTIREWEKLEPKQIYELLQNCSLNARASAKKLIQVMADGAWRLKATAHVLGSKNPNDRLHITIKIDKEKKAHHLYCREISDNRGLQITGITKG
ncbi:MAG: hypothetical protein L3J70_11215 [Gammaproteobacteria bacterium]|nr:hypothetical protein [Gammaproteobacteria bacterium]